VASITTVGLGPDRPLALNSTAAGKARNRRIDLVIGAQ
jgi:outer membrane protein OmpA-like peptidoglycan-associated protein